MDITGQALDTLLLSKISDPIGTVKQSMLGETPFNDENLGSWALMDGRSSVGTEYETLTGETSIPDLVTEGLFPRQTKIGRVVGSEEGDAIRNITGAWSVADTTATNGTASGSVARVNSPTNSRQPSTSNRSWKAAQFNFNAGTQVPTSTENRPKNVAFNFYIKTDHT
jgi:hypothetical protein